MKHCFFFNDTATTEIYTLSLHDALPICLRRARRGDADAEGHGDGHCQEHFEGGGKAHASTLDDAAESAPLVRDRKSTRLNSSHANISYAVFCLKKNKFFLSNFKFHL